MPVQTTPRKGVVNAFFEKGVGRIEHPLVKATVDQIMRNVVDAAFWVAPASSSLKYHPSWQNETSGLVRHCVEMLALAPRALAMYGDMYEAGGRKLAQINLDMLLAAVSLHDAFKNGKPWGANTHPQHHAVAADAWMQVSQVYQVPEPIRQTVREAIYYHAGRWTERNTFDIPPVGSVTAAMHTLDMVSSANELMEVFLPRPFPDPETVNAVLDPIGAAAKSGLSWKDR